MARFVGIGDLVLDYYYKDNILIGVNGGKTTSNIIFNLAYLGNNTALFGTCGNDTMGTICIDSLKQVGVDTENIEIKNIDTRRLHINITKDGQTTKKRCPICDTKNWYEVSEINIETIIKKLNPSDIIMIDDLNEVIINLLSRIKNKIMLDLGYYRLFEKISNQELIDSLNYSYEIINMNERVEKYLIERLRLSNSLELYNLLKTKLLIITKGKNGADFIYDDILYNKPLEVIANEIDPNGAGDMFFTSIINDYRGNDFSLNNDLLDIYFRNANNLTLKVVSNIGARTYEQPLYKIKKLDTCSCISFTR